MSDVPDQSAQGGTGTAPVDFVALSAGRTIGRYQIVSVLGQGGFGITYRAHDSQLDREVAIKEYLPLALAVRQDGTTVLPRSTDAAADFAWGRERFVAEGRTLASLQNAPAIVRVFDFLEANGTAYIVMQLLSGETLEHRLKQKGPLGPADVDRILWPLLDGLDQVHATGFLHRDIKPANILLDGAGNPTLIDFGASRAAMAGRTTALTAIFTPGYAAAEQMTSAKQGPWTDIYGLSATLYHAITGKTPPGAFDRMLDDGYEPLGGKSLPGFSPGLLVGIDAGLALRASDRPQSIAGWRLILGQTTAPGGHATVAMARQGDGVTVLAAPAPGAASVVRAVEAPAVAAAVPVPAKSRMLLFVGIAVAVLALAGAGGYVAFAPGGKPSPTGTALQDLKIEDLERVLAERRKADAAAAEKKRLEEEAQRKADADAAGKKAADTELEKAQQARLKAEQELAQMKADVEARRQAEAGQREQADAAARRAAEEAAQRRAEAEMAALRQAEDDARKKAAVEADAKRQADEALVKAQAERQKAEAEAKQKAEAEAKQKAESSTKEVAAAEARQKAEAEAEADANAKQKADAEATAAAVAAAEKKAAEAAETALRLAAADRQRLQVALTSLGFDTRGSDGAFGPRTREMIANWQRGHSYPATGFLTGAQSQALLREASPAVARFDDEQKKIEEAKKKADEDKAKAEAAAKAAPVPTAPVPQTAAAAPNIAAAAPRSGSDGLWKGSYECTTSRHGGEFNIQIQMTVSGGVGTWTRPGSGPNTRGNQSITVKISGAQVAVSRLFSPANQPGVIATGTMTARYEGNSISGGGPEAGSGGRTCNISLTRGP
jgi:peptidoglycan hydrolase-like protein with peptidoglycan-binding domain